VRLPRDLSGTELIKALRRLGYEVSRSHGSHFRLTTNVRGEHHLTVPNHDSLRVGTLNSLINDVAGHHNLSREEVLRLLFV
jgi:predicted RNA binding protein YcfA (HicA-like mRNA interferase family)